jgi:outer membrane protein assembly factor BamB
MTVRAGFALSVLVLTGASGFAQGRGAGNWSTAGSDAQRTAWMRAETRIAAATLPQRGFQLLWKKKLDGGPRQTDALTQPLLLQNLISHKGFKALAFVGSSSDTVYAIDYDLSKTYWQTRLSSASGNAGTTECPRGLPILTRALQIAAPAAAGRGGPPLGINPNNLPITNAVYVVSSGGMVHVLNPHVGGDLLPPVKFLPPNAHTSGAIVVDNVLYTAAVNGCGGARPGVWAVDMSSDSKPVTSWDSEGAAMAGGAGPAFGTEATLFVATQRSPSGASAYANAVVALEPRTLKVKSWFTAQAPFATSPVVFQYKGRELVAAANSDGRIHLFAGSSIGGTDHQTSLAASAPVGPLATTSGALATWEDTAGIRWLLAASTTGLRAVKIADAGGTLTLEPGWSSRELASPLAPLVMNDVVFALSGSRASPVLYAFNAADGKELWSSGTSIATPLSGAPPSGSDGQIYVAAADGTLYAFGIPLEH